MNLPECEIFEHKNFNTGNGSGDGFRFRTSLPVPDLGADLNDKVSSVIVYAGKWRFYKDKNFSGAHFELGVGHHNVPSGFSDAISSYEPVSY